MKTFLLLLLILVGGFAFWEYNKTQKKQTPSVEDGSFTHIVVKGDTLYSLAQKHNTTVSDIKQRNQLADNTLHVGNKLQILAGVKSTTPPASKPTVAKKESPSKELPKPKKTKAITKKELPESTVMETSSIAIDIDDKNQVYLKTKNGKFKPAGSIVYGSDADENGIEIKTITYRDLQGKETTLPGSADPESVIRLTLKKR